MSVSNCCGARPRGNGDCDSSDVGICPECLEHCEYITEEQWEEKTNPKREWQVMFFKNKNMLEPIDSEYYINIPSKEEIETLSKKLEANYAQLYRDKHNDESYDYLEAEFEIP